jgi:hypothetical protein
MKSIFASFLIVVTVASFSTNLLAQGTPPPPPTAPASGVGGTDAKNFEAHKAQMLSHMNEKTADMEKFRTCINTAKSPEEMQKCRKENREIMKNMRMHNMDSRMKEMQERRNKMGDK